MKVHAIQTGFVRIKSAQVEGHGHGLVRRLAIFIDRSWTEWLPTYAWVYQIASGGHAKAPSRQPKHRAA
jgi:N-acyl homoserine lactone hydrolase